MTLHETMNTLLGERQEGNWQREVMLRRPEGQVRYLEGCRHKPRHARSTRGWRPGRTVPPAFERTMALMIHCYKCLDSKTERINCLKPLLLQPILKRNSIDIWIK